MKKYYAVKNGRVPGIYMTWSECEAQVKGFSGATYKSFSSESDAKDFIGISNSKVSDIIKDEIHVYVDGSYNSDTNEYGYGCYIDFGDYQQILCGRGKCEDGGRNVEGEVSGAIAAIKFLIAEYKKIVIHYDYEGIGKWADKIWKANKYYTQGYAKFVELQRANCLDVSFEHVKGHSNNEYNELVDKLAKYACGVTLTNTQINSLTKYNQVLGYPNLSVLPNLDVSWNK